MRAVLYTRCLDRRVSHNNPFGHRPLKTYYSPNVFEAPYLITVHPNEHILISLEDDDLLYTYYGGCCCGGCVSMSTNQMLTLEVTNTNAKYPVIMYKGSRLSTLLDHDYIDHKLCISFMNDVTVSRFDENLDMDGVHGDKLLAYSPVLTLPSPVVADHAPGADVAFSHKSTVNGVTSSTADTTHD